MHSPSVFADRRDDRTVAWLQVVADGFHAVHADRNATADGLGAALGAKTEASARKPTKPAMAGARTAAGSTRAAEPGGSGTTAPAPSRSKAPLTLTPVPHRTKLPLSSVLVVLGRSGPASHTV